MRAASIQFTAAIAAGLKKRGGKSLTLLDFLPTHYHPKPKELTEEEANAAIKKAFAEFITSTPPNSSTPHSPLRTPHS